MKGMGTNGRHISSPREWTPGQIASEQCISLAQYMAFASIGIYDLGMRNEWDEARGGMCEKLIAGDVEGAREIVRNLVLPLIEKRFPVEEVAKEKRERLEELLHEKFVRE